MPTRPPRLYSSCRNSSGNGQPPGGGSGPPSDGIGTGVGSPPTDYGAPPEEPPVDNGGWGDGGGDELFGLPLVPPLPQRTPNHPFQILNTTLTPLTSPLYAMCTLGGWRNPHANPMDPECPPPAAMGLYIYPIQYVEVQTRQYYQPPSPMMGMPMMGMPMMGVQLPPNLDITPKSFRKLGWNAGLPVQERYCMFAVAGQLQEFGQLSTPYCAWELLTMDTLCVVSGYPGNAIQHAILQSKRRFLTPHPAATQHTMNLYEQAQIPGVTPLVCVTGNWNPHLMSEPTHPTVDDVFSSDDLDDDDGDRDDED